MTFVVGRTQHFFKKFFKKQRSRQLQGPTPQRRACYEQLDVEIKGDSEFFELLCQFDAQLSDSKSLTSPKTIITREILIIFLLDSGHVRPYPTV